MGGSYYIHYFIGFTDPGGSGGYTEAIINVGTMTAGSQLIIQVGQGGTMSTDCSATMRPYPNGGLPGWDIYILKPLCIFFFGIYIIITMASIISID